jgi:hypothetical protein
MCGYRQLIPLILLFAGAFGCHGEQSAPTRPEGPYIGQEPPDLTPVVFAPGWISRASNQSGVNIFPGGCEVYFFEVRDVSRGVSSTIYVTKEVDGIWTHPTVASFSGTYVDGYPALHPDGSRLYFQSNRPIDSAESLFEWNLWYVERTGDGWGEPRSMGRPINGFSHTGGPSVTSDGTFYFTRMDLSSGHSEIFRSRLLDGVYQQPERLPDAVNALFQTCDSYVAPDESYLLFVAFPGTGHTGNPGGLYVSFPDSTGTWSGTRDLRPTLASVEGGYATISPDGRFLFFTRRDPAGRTGLDVYWVSSDIVHATGPVTEHR